MDGVLTADDTVRPATPEEVERLLSSGQFFWLDLDGIDDESRDLLLTRFRLHHLAVEDAQQFGQRPKLDEYDDFTYLVVHGAPSDGTGTTEVHFFVTEHYVVTVHRGPCRAMDQARTRIGRQRHAHPDAPQIVIVYVIIDDLVDSFFPMLDRFDSQIDTLEDAILVRPTDEQLGTLFTMKRDLLSVHKVVTPQRDLFASITSGVAELPGVSTEGQRYLRDVYDHLIRIGDLVDSYRDLLSGVMDTHLSTVSNRLNVVMKQLTIIATIFLPLTFLTGFFGQNFAWLIRRITGGWPFFVLGIGLEVVSALALLYLFRKRGWLGGPTA